MNLSSRLPVGAVLAVSMSFAVTRQVANKRFGGVMRWFRRGLPLAVEVLMMLGSARLAYTLLTNQLYFEHFGGPWDWIVSHGEPYSNEWVWGLIAGTSALLKGIGIFLCLTYRRDVVMLDLAYGFRLFGWLASCVWCATFAISLTVWDPLSYVAIASSLATGLAFWGLLMGPAMPDDGRG